MIDISEIKELLKTNSDGYLYHRESQTLEFKEQFNFAGLADYFRDFAAFANNKGGYIIFGVKDKPRRELIGLNESSLNQFERIDPERISGFLLDIFSSQIHWEQIIFEINENKFGIFKIYEAPTKPIIAKKDEGKDQVIKNGEIYFRYGGRTQKIRFPELESIINKRIEKNNNQWLKLMSKIAKTGPSNAAILDLENSFIESTKDNIMVIDEELVKKLSFIKEGEFVEQEGKQALKLIGDVVPVSQLEVIKKVKENIIKLYPLSAMELVNEIKKQVPNAKQNEIWEIIRENDIKNNPDYSVYNFRNKRHADHFEKTGQIPSGTPSIYNEKAVEFIVNILKQRDR